MERATLNRDQDISPEFRQKARRSMANGHATNTEFQAAELARSDSLRGQLNRIISDHSERERTELHCAIRDALTEIRHLCDIHQLDFDALNDRAIEVYREELGIGDERETH